MILEPTAYHHKLLNDEMALIVSERLTLSPRFPVHIGEYDNRDGLSRETEPLVTLAKALDYAAALVAAERERCAKIIEDHCEIMGGSYGKKLGPRREGDRMSLAYAAAIREGGEHG